MRIHIPSAVAAARESTPAGPRVSAADREALVVDMREAAETSYDLLLDAMRLDREAEDAARQRAAADRILVVDRLGWVKANALMLQDLIDEAEVPSRFSPALSRGSGGDAASGVLGALGAARASANSLFAGAEARSTGVQLGAVLGILSRRVLGQYEPVRQPGALLLNAPTILEMESRLELRPRDFRLWVAFHETTHRVQLALAPWIRDEVVDRVRRLLAAEESLGDLLAELPEALRGEVSLAQAALSPEGRSAMADLTAIMTLLEGHADVMMDRAGKRVIPTVRSIRRVFDANRGTGTGLKAVAMRLLGAGDKIAQYEDGARFVTAVMREVGMDGFNRVWTDPAMLPSAEELRQPSEWIARAL